MPRKRSLFRSDRRVLPTTPRSKNKHSRAKMKKDYVHTASRQPPPELMSAFVPGIVVQSIAEMCHYCTWVKHDGRWELKFKYGLCPEHGNKPNTYE